MVLKKNVNIRIIRSSYLSVNSVNFLRKWYIGFNKYRWSKHLK